MNVEKISVALNKRTLKRLEDRAKLEGVSRSRLVEIALVDYLDEFSDDNSNVLGILNLVYDDTAGNEIIATEHQFESLIISTLHIHVDDKNCMEAVALRGRRADLENLVKSLTQIHGVKKAKLMISLEVSR
ncbi:MAG: CopG family ribbon-helix-helix protein [Metallosphaera sp.]|uniref:CopG family transcriptional regulator n=1 Tax=Metallosphaera cuprina (strain Ar-4) TaxID=1006006 RepID=F4FZ81_METCR|nr:CopG family ribbon-helix-helix protein [Metallosphaera cuprina]AEB94390.1 CopG family transcriptional regulator [Metallosphaera cuprina Ar-4]